MSDDNTTRQFAHIENPNKRLFLQAYWCHANVKKAADVAGVDRTRHYAWLSNDTEYEEAFALCRKSICYQIEEGLVGRLANGWDEPVFQNGEEVGVKRRYDNTNAMKYLEKVNRQVFGDDKENAPSVSIHEVADAIIAMRNTVPSEPDSGRSDETVD